MHAKMIGIFMSHSGGSRSSLPYCCKIIITHGKDIRILSNSSTSRLALHFENPIFTTSRTTFIVVVIGNPLIQRTRSLCHKLVRREV